jgi:N-formylglutamate amidohydrolase
MVELNRSLYMDESTGEKSADFADLESLVAACISAASSYQEAWDDGVDTGPPRESPPP